MTNVAIGYAALDANTTNNVAIGIGALNVTTTNNVAIGYEALNVDTINAPANIAIGYGAAYEQSGQNNVVIGHNADSLDYSDTIILGVDAKAKPCSKCGTREKLIVLGEVCVCQTCLQALFAPTQRYTCYVCQQTTMGSTNIIAMPEANKHGKTIYMGLCHTCLRDQALAAHAREQSAQHGFLSTEERLAKLEAKLAKVTESSNVS